MRKKNGILQAAVMIGVMLCVCGCQSDGGAASVTAGNTGVAVQAGENEDVDTGADINTGADIDTGADTVSPEVPQEDAAAENTVDGYFYVVDGVTVGVDMDMDELAAELGESKSIFEAPSCAGEGISYIYNYGSYEIETYPATDGKNRIGYITLRDDMTATAEGIDLSMTKADVILVYGEDYEEGENVIIYEKDGTKLNFIFNEDNIISIEYVSAVIG